MRSASSAHTVVVSLSIADFCHAGVPADAAELNRGAVVIIEQVRSLALDDRVLFVIAAGNTSPCDTDDARRRPELLPGSVRLDDVPLQRVVRVQPYPGQQLSSIHPEEKPRHTSPGVRV
jgi:hypothetical protein